MEGHFYTGLLTFLGTVGFLLLASPTIRKALISDFDLFSASREKQIEIPVRFRCHKCDKVNLDKATVREKDVGKKIALNCGFCTSLHDGSEVSTINMLYIPFPEIDGFKS